MQFLTFTALVRTLTLLALSASATLAQDYPSRPLRIVVPNSPGTSQDVTSRFLAAELPKVLGQPIIVENRPGAGMVIGTEYVLKQLPADGYALASVQVETISVLPLTVRDLRLDPNKDMSSVITVFEGQLMLASPSSAPWRTFQEMVAYAKANPGKLNYGASSVVQILPTEGLARDLGIKIVKVPYTGGGPFIQALISGETHLGFAAALAIAPGGDKLRVIAVTGDSRSPRYPDAPTFKELGHPRVPGFSASIAVRQETPRPIVNRLNSALNTVLSSAAAREQFAKLQLDIVGGTPEAADRRLADTAKFFAETANRIGYKPE